MDPLAGKSLGWGKSRAPDLLLALYLYPKEKALQVDGPRRNKGGQLKVRPHMVGKAKEAGRTLG